MNENKIDARLLNQIQILNFNRKAPCFVYGRNFYETKAVLERNSIQICNEYLFINSFYCKASQKEIFALSNLCEIDYIFSIATASCMMFVSKKILNTESLSFYGEGVGIAFIDTGLAPHCDFMVGKNRICLFKDFVADKTSLYDDNGHGTFVCGVCSGNGALSKFKYSGTAPKSNIFSLKALNESGEASANKILDAMEWVYDNHKKQGIDVVCMSFGSEPLGANDPIMIGADSLWKDGVVVVAAAGNSGPEYQTIKSPGISSKIITVGGIDDNRYDDMSFDKNFFEMAKFSSRGPAFRKTKPDVVAPSVDIVSCGIKQNYTKLSGTSVATPMIAGLSALLLEKYKGATPTEIKNILLKISQPLGFEMNYEGYGLPNLKNLKIN
ncbi:MAG: peptidase S8 [Clostridiales bacterium]|nr:peptidase S8 [Clostridiales bacterium]